jgi:hypothetical protein
MELEKTCSADLIRQFSLWPFGTRTLRLLLLVDPDRAGQALQRGLLRAMQEAAIGSETGSLTNAVRAAVDAAQFVLQHHNHDVLPQDHATAAAAVAATRGGFAYVALVGDAAAFTWRSGTLDGQRSVARIGRPLGLERQPRVTLWSSPMLPGDRLVLVCGATWPSAAEDVLREILRGTPTDVAERRLAETLGARVLVAHQPAGRQIPHVRSGSDKPKALRRRSAPPRVAWRRWLAPLVPLSTMVLGGVAALGPSAEPQHLALAQQAEVLLDQAQQSRDVYAAHTFAASARDFAQRAAILAPVQHGPLVTSAERTLDEIDRVHTVQPMQSVRFGLLGTNVVDLAVGADALYMLDVVEAAVRRFAVDAVDQQPTPETLLVRKGATIGGRRLDTPVAIQYVAGPASAAGSLTIIDQARAVVQLSADGVASARLLPSVAAWERLGALGAGADGDLYVLDSGSRRVLEYAGASLKLVDPPRPLLDASVTDMAFDQVAEMLAVRDLYVRSTSGVVRRFNRLGGELSFVIRPPDGRRVVVAAMASDRAGGLYVADPGNARVLHTTADGDFVRQLRDPALAGVRQLQSSLDGGRLYALVASGVLAFDLPADIPAPVPNPEPDTVQEPQTLLPK